MDIIPEKWRNRWSSNEIRVLVLTSLGMQMGLIFLAPLRKRCNNMGLGLILWLLYLTADYVATLALGNISNQADPAECGDSGTIPGKLTVLWTPFLLLHLGGPDSITSYSVEDNELWWRHLLGLVVQVIITVYVFWISPPNGWLWIPTLLVFISGLIKYAERTHALRLGSKRNLKGKIISQLSPANEDEKVGFISQIERECKIDMENQLIMEGYGWVNIFKSLWIDVTFSQNLLMKSQAFFSDISPLKAFKLVAIELSFLYDILHTKAVHIHCTSGRVLRCFSLVTILVALVVFHFLDMQKYASKDIIITYILFGAGLSIEVIATVFLVLSDWTVMSLSRREGFKCFASSITAMVNGKSRWSGTIGQYNLVGLFLRDRNIVFAWIMRKLKIKDNWDNMCETRFIPVTDLLEDIMFTQAVSRAENVHTRKVLVEARSYRGRKTSEYYGQLEILGWSMKRAFDECIIFWHLATQICYYISEPSKEDISKYHASYQISNYMVYLLIRQPSMMQLGYGTTRFDATRALVKKLDRDVIKEVFKSKENMDDVEAHKLLENARTLLAQDEKVSELAGCIQLAQVLLGLNENIRWKLISEVWMEMLIYAAIHCDAYQHAKSLSRGGELLTHLWLLMAHLGVVEEHMIEQFEFDIV